MKRYKYATVEKLDSGKFCVYFSDMIEEMDSIIHITRSEYDTKEQVVKSIKKYVQPKKGSVNKLKDNLTKYYSQIGSPENLIIEDLSFNNFGD
jgi:hypothetical protein